jgi:hypothetical protein
MIAMVIIGIFTHSICFVNRKAIFPVCNISCENLSSHNGADYVPSTVTKEEFQMTRLCRYYHVFKEGELSDLIFSHVDNLSVQSCMYDHGNWCLTAEKITRKTAMTRRYIL